MTPSQTRALRLLFVFVGLLPWILAFSPRAAALLGPMFHGLCHQRPERTLALFGAPMVVCSRCAGLFAGMALGAIVKVPDRLLRHGRVWVLSAAGLAALDVVTQDLGMHPPFHPTRLATGFLLGFAATAFLIASVLREAQRDALPSPPRTI